jgi:alkylation response protein AidB-like acyl-CoA dehydrogenase
VDFAFTPDQELLRETARNLLARECRPEVLRAHRDDPGAAEPLWNHLRDFSALGAASAVDLCAFTEELGYVAAPGRFFATTALFQPVLAAVGSDLVDAAAAGEITGTVALAGADGLWTLNGDVVKTFVPEADAVDVIARVDRTDDDRASVTLLEDAESRRVETVDSTRRVFELDAVVGEPVTIDPTAISAALDRATVVVAAELVGTARRLFDMSLQYAKERQQFGVPIGSFQAIQHKLADMSLDVERAWSAVYYAAMALDAGDGIRDGERARSIHVAKAAAGEAAKRAAKDGIQIHGGIGYTWEHDLHLFIRRAYASEALLGPTGWHHDRLADLLIER